MTSVVLCLMLLLLPCASPFTATPSQLRTCSRSRCNHQFAKRSSELAQHGMLPYRVASLAPMRVSATMEPPPTADSQDSSKKRVKPFGQRMRDIVTRQRTTRKRGGPNRNRSSVDRGGPTNLQTVYTLEEYKEAVADEKEKIVVVRFFATWCRACRAVAPFFYRLCESNPNVSFVEVPITDKNMNLHQGLHVQSLPYAHIYHPDAGLVEELRISRTHFHLLEQRLQWYLHSSCDLKDVETSPPLIIEEAEEGKHVV